MRILLLTQWFEPEPALKGLGFARALRDEGHDVEVITGFPNYPGGRVYPGYRIKLFQREVIEGIPVLRVALYPSHDQSAGRRILNYGSFAIAAASLGSLLTQRPDVIYVYHPPLTVGLAAIALGAFKRTPFVYDVQDLWPDTLAATGMMRHRLVLSLVGSIARWIYRRASYVVAQSPGFERRLLERGVPSEKLQVIYNWCNEEQLKPGKNSEIVDQLQAGTRFNVVFAGTMGKAQGLDSVLQAAKLLDHSGSRARFVLIGGGIEAERLGTRAKQLGLSNVLFLPRVPMSEIGQVLLAADVLLVHLKVDPLFEITIPGKTQAYLAAGKPVLMCVRGDAADLITRSGGGLICEPEDPKSLAETVTELEAMEPSQREAVGKRGKDYYQARLSLAIGTRQFIRVFDHAVKNR